MRTIIRMSGIVIMMSLFTATLFIHPAMAADATKLDHTVAGVLKKLYAKYPAALELSKVAKGVKVFPSITKAGLVTGGQYGEGAILGGGKTVGYYNTVAGS
jgi:lipid-binding SYLF domain-containing protein